MSRSVSLYTPSTARPVTSAYNNSQIVLIISAILFVVETLVDFRYNAEFAHNAGLDAAKAGIGGGVSIVLGLLLYGTVYYLMKRRFNNGRMLGMGLAVLGLLMSILNIVIDFPDRILSIVVYAIIGILSIVWLVITNKPEVTNLLKK